jgi:signal transduction histidine kinase
MSRTGNSSSLKPIENRRSKRLPIPKETFLNLGQKLSSANTAKEAGRIILKAADKLLGWDCAYLYVYSPEEQRVYPVLIVDLKDGRKVEFPTRYIPYEPTNLVSRVLERGAQLILRSKQDISSHGMIPFGDTTRLSASIIIVPIRKKSRTTGFLSINSYTHNAYSRDDLDTLQSLADHCGGALERIGAQEALRENEQKLRALATRLRKVREEESLRIAREIHDEMGQSMTSLKIDLLWLKKRILNLDRRADPLFERIESMVQITDGAIKSVRKICTELRPRILDDLGLLAAMEWQANEFERRTGIDCELFLPKTALALDQERATTIFRILQEIFTNVARHAQASAVSVRFRTTKRELFLVVQDNGRGIGAPETNGTKSLGLLGMRERALAFGGEVRIIGARGQGTTVSVRIPLHSKAKGAV